MLSKKSGNKSSNILIWRLFRRQRPPRFVAATSAKYIEYLLEEFKFVDNRVG